jgi:hypothetical protein
MKHEIQQKIINQSKVTAPKDNDNQQQTSRITSLNILLALFAGFGCGIAGYLANSYLVEAKNDLSTHNIHNMFCQENQCQLNDENIVNVYNMCPR